MLLKEGWLTAMLTLEVVTRVMGRKMGLEVVVELLENVNDNQISINSRSL